MAELFRILIAAHDEHSGIVSGDGPDHIGNIHAIQRRCGEQLLSGLTPQEQAQFWSLLEKLLDNGAALAEEVKA